jgi:stage II sporulation protein D (peptidoglycan lytic transglycosylase)
VTTTSLRRLASVSILGLLLAVVVDAQPQRTARPAPPPVRPVVGGPRTIRVGVARQGTYTIRAIPIEEYVAGVLVGEAMPDSPPALLDALAIAIRTYALKNLERHRTEGFDVCDQTHCQVLRTPTDATTQAATRTAGRVLTWQGGLATVYYSASCGGHTEVPSAVWPDAEDVPYLPSKRDEGCGGTPEWAIELRATDVERALTASGFRGSLKAVRILARDESGRVTGLAVDGLTPSRVSSQDFRMAIGAQSLKSTAFEMRKTGMVYRFSGRGYGHGVGMCVIGATRLAAVGESADALLTRYYPGTTISSIELAAPDVPVGTSGTSSPPPAAVPTPAARTSNALEALTARARADLASLLQIVPPAPLPIQVHGSSSEYERATGRDWFTLAALVDGQIHLMPLDELEQRGVLERVLRREIVHGWLDAQLANRPRWVREGAALFFSDPRPNEADARGPCPSDAELERPLSAGALSQAYARARACFARQIASGRTWRDVR